MATITRTISSTPEFIGAVQFAFHRIRNLKASVHDAMEELCVNMAEMWNLHTDMDEDCAMFWQASARGKKPACIVISPNVGQTTSPNARVVHRGRHYLLQYFEKGADDAGLADPSEGVGYQFETEDRMLFC